MKIGFAKSAATAAGLAIAVASSAVWADGDPKVATCKVITTPAQLKAINNSAASLNDTYCLGKDIDLGGVNFTPIGGIDGSTAFRGHFYGRGHVIKNLKITGTTPGYYGLFGPVLGGVIRDVGVVNVDINVNTSTGYVGGLVGFALASTPAFISGTYSTGQVTCTGSICYAGGLIGVGSNNLTLTDSWSSANVRSSFYGGGLAGILVTGPSTYNRLYATGNVTRAATAVGLGGLIGAISGAEVFLTQAYATGKVVGGTNTFVGGLIGTVTKSFVQSVYATGPVSGGAGATVGGLIGAADDGTVQQAFSVGRVTGGTTKGGLIGTVANAPSVSNAYWDQTTSGQAASAAGTARTTAQLRANLPPGFSSGWAINKTLSYPILADPDNFSSTLATLVATGRVFAFLPIKQTDKSQYTGNPAHMDAASLGTVYTMIARAIGITDNVGALANAKISVFWNDATQTAHLTPALDAHINLGTMTNIAAAANLSVNVVQQMKSKRLVILRGTYTKAAGGTATHYMLGTLYTKNANNTVNAVIANDPATGRQVEISPKTKQVVTPGFPLSGFKVDGYQAVTALN